jgi:hypothetical protein
MKLANLNYEPPEKFRWRGRLCHRVAIVSEPITWEGRCGVVEYKLCVFRWFLKRKKDWIYEVQPVWLLDLEVKEGGE